MTSKKRSSKKKTSPQSSSGNPCTNEEIITVEEFEVEQEEKEAYWDALCDPSGVLQSSERGCVSSPGAWESAEDPPEGFFTCYEAFLTRCRMWFPIPEAIVRTLDRFELLILSYELGMDLSLDDFEGLWSTRKTSIDYSYCIAPKGHTSNAKGWFENFFYVRIDGASVEENCLPLFRGKWNFHRGTTVGNLVRIDTRRIQNAVALYRSRGISRPLRASDMDEPHPDAVPDQRERVRPQKDKGIALEDKNFVSKDLPLPGWNPGFTQGDGSGTSEAPLPDDFFANLPPGFTTPVSLDEASRREVVAEGSRLINEEMRVFNSTLDGSFREARLSHFKAEEIERKFIRFQNEVAERERIQAESHSPALIRAERKGRRTISAELARRATLFDAEFRSFMDAQDYVGDFRECRSSVGTLWKSQNADFSFLSEVAEKSGLIDGCAQAESMVPPIEGRIRELWEPIEVLEDTTEAGADAANEGGEVDQPADSFGASISGYLDLDL
ncbi:hypothetical protein F2Q68_00011259 [Brassica cretica]|uniref:Uncharacterized protein n=1 Tax=Brassica cretica TaxID=69181 RepID=A0A8S9KNF2_BRACR|nr:hypothetical protein F2Q68_00011259 [Brassica cretica]